MKNIVIRSNFGHEIMAVRFAEAYGVKALIIPDCEDFEEYENRAEGIFSSMSFFSTCVKKVPFNMRHMFECRDIIAELKAGQLADEEWDIFFNGRCKPTRDTSFLPQFSVGLNDNEPAVLFVPQKLKSDGECGVTAEQQSLTPAVFNFLKSAPCQLVLGQHFNKMGDIEQVVDLATEFGLYVPGLTENPEVLGIRGVKHEMYYNMYKHLGGSIGIAGTHTWIMLAMFPDIPQIILYNKGGVERWDAIAVAANRAGHKIFAIGFDENTDMEELAKKIEDLAYNG
jgi:hypothetical protein